MNATLQKFGDPETRVKMFEQWVVLLRPQQVTLGSLVIVCKEEATAFSELSSEAFLELRDVTRYVEGVLARVFSFEKINYLMLMMVDPDVHFHVFPRYSEPRIFAEQEFVDAGWPGPPNLKQVNTTSLEFNQMILSHLKSQ
ncbi:MAG: HIT family protein [Nitrospirales bacterium]|nr:MAG: HIT family protein [Nitrospirales bacterium]